MQVKALGCAAGTEQLNMLTSGKEWWANPLVSASAALQGLYFG